MILVALTAVVAARVGFVLRADAAVTRAALRADHAHPALPALAKVITQVGAPVTVDVVCAMAVVVAAWRRRWTAAVIVLIARLVSLGAEQVLKDSVDRARPLHQLVHAGGPSYPSAHSTGIAVLTALAAIAVWVAAPGAARRPACAVLALVAAAVATSRVLLGVHYLTDVLAGLFLGTDIACATVLVTLSLTTRRPRRHVLW